VAVRLSWKREMNVFRLFSHSSQIGNDCGVDPRFGWMERMKIESWELPREIEHYPWILESLPWDGMGCNRMNWKGR
jgi:hypothetical protein